MQARRVFGRSIPVPLLAALTVGLVVLAAWGFVAAFRSSPERRAIVIPPPPNARSSVTAREVRRWIDAGLPTLTAHRAAAWRTALPARGVAARRALRDLYDHLAPIPWSGLHAVVSAISGQLGAFDVKIEGRPGGAGPPQRIVAERLLVVERSGGGGGGAPPPPPPPPPPPHRRQSVGGDLHPVAAAVQQDDHTKTGLGLGQKQ
jgi:hypothetical protein